MKNHYHLLLETPEGNLVAGMKWLQGTYTQRYNVRHALWPPLPGPLQGTANRTGGDIPPSREHLHSSQRGAGRLDQSWRPKAQNLCLEQLSILHRRESRDA